MYMEIYPIRYMFYIVVTTDISMFWKIKMDLFFVCIY